MEAMLNWLWQGAVIGVAALIMLHALERARANVRYTVCWAAMLAILLLPVVPFLRTLSLAPATGAPAAGAVLPLPSAWWTSTLVIAAAWALWALIQCVRFVRAVVAVRRARACSQPFPLDLELTLPHWRSVHRLGRAARLVMSESVGSAAVLGWGRPRIAVAPAVVHALNADDLDRILVHEWAHVQRRDDLQQLLQVAARVVAGWHPAIWLLDRRLQVEREIACDETTVAVTGSAKSYAHCLLTLSAQRPVQTMAMAPAALLPSALHARVVKIVSPHPSMGPWCARSIASSIVAVLCVVCVTVGGVKIVGATTLALPFAPAPAQDTLVQTPVSLAVPTIASALEPARQPRRQAGMQAAPQPVIVPETQPAAAATHVDAPEHVGANAPAESQNSAIAAVDAPPEATPSPPSTVAAENPPTPWGAAAAGSATIARKSKGAGVATAGFFSRVAKQVAGSF